MYHKSIAPKISAFTQLISQTSSTQLYYRQNCNIPVSFLISSALYLGNFPKKKQLNCLQIPRTSHDNITKK